MRNILVIEDDLVTALHMSTIIEGMGFAVTGPARRKDEAISLATACQPSLVLADVELADGDCGIAAIEEILRTVLVPVIFVTGHSKRVIINDVLEPTFVISKPFHPRTLEVAIDHVMR